MSIDHLSCFPMLCNIYGENFCKVFTMLRLYRIFIFDTLFSVCFLFSVFCFLSVFYKKLISWMYRAYMLLYYTYHVLGSLLGLDLKYMTLWPWKVTVKVKGQSGVEFSKWSETHVGTIKSQFWALLSFDLWPNSLRSYKNTWKINVKGLYDFILHISWVGVIVGTWP